MWLTPLIESLLLSQIDTLIAEPVLSGDVDGHELALIIRNGNKYLINSNLIHLDAAYILSHLLGGPLTRPATADIAFDSDQALIFAEYDTRVEMDLPWPDWTHVLRYDPLGNLDLDDLENLGGHLDVYLERGELLVLGEATTTAVQASQSDSSGADGDLQCFPNPFNARMTIRYEVMEPGPVSLRIYDTQGREIVELVNEYQTRGMKSISWQGRDRSGVNMSSGLYFTRLKTDKTSLTRKLLLLK